MQQCYVAIYEVSYTPLLVVQAVFFQQGNHKQQANRHQCDYISVQVLLCCISIFYAIDTENVCNTCI